jgi:alpha-beta hydrolase superfamily lysophospholipase
MTISQSSYPSAADNLRIATYFWPAASADARGVVQIAHGIAEHAERYDRLAKALSAANFAVYASDHRGHGRSINDDTALGSFGAAGWPGLVADVAAFGKSVVTQNVGLPVFLLGHSMGSFASQEVILDHSDQYAGLILSGSTALDVMAAGLAESGGAESGDLSFLNAGFENRTGYEWLSRDEDEVDKYVADPLSGFALSPESVPAIFGSAARLADPEALGGIREDLPILVVSGDADPLSGGGQLVALLAQRYRDAGISDVILELFPGARHEIFNETNRDEVTAFVIDWLERHS